MHPGPGLQRVRNQKELSRKRDTAGYCSILAATEAGIAVWQTVQADYLPDPIPLSIHEFGSGEDCQRQQCRGCNRGRSGAAEQRNNNRSHLSPAKLHCPTVCGQTNETTSPNPQVNAHNRKDQLAHILSLYGTSHRPLWWALSVSRGLGQGAKEGREF